ncbi:MAG TPA: CopG family antitoxin [Rubrobacter sp.]|nr:CopG family antitoxin [Rubrobacter sp.]
MEREIMKEIQSREEIPQFANEAEEAEFWATHSLGEEFLAKMEPLPKDVLPPARPRTQPISLRLDSDVLERVRALAEIKHKGYQTLIKEFLVERLYEEEKREGLLPAVPNGETKESRAASEPSEESKPKLRNWQSEAYTFVRENEALLEDPDLDQIALSRLAQNSSSRLLELSKEIQKASRRPDFPATQLQRMMKGYHKLKEFSEEALTLYAEKFEDEDFEGEQDDNTEPAAYQSVIEEAERILEES